MNNRPKVLYIIPHLGIGGTTSNMRTIGALAGDKMDIHVLCLSSDGQGVDQFPNTKFFQYKPIHRRYCSISNANGLIAKCRIAFLKVYDKLFTPLNLGITQLACRRIEKSGFDCVIAFQEGTATWFASHIRHHNKLAWVRCGYDSYQEIVGGKDERTMYASFRRVICVSDYCRGRFLEFYPEMYDKVITIRNPQFLDRFIEKGKEPSPFAAEKDVFHIVSVGRFDPVKRFESIPVMASKMKEAGCKFIWTLIGEGVTFNDVQSNVEKCDVSDCVELVGRQDNPYKYIAHSDLFVILSTSEAYPSVVQEAKVLHIPIVAANFGSSYEVIDQEKPEGIISEFERIPDVITSLINDQSKYEQLKEGVSHYQYDNQPILGKTMKVIEGRY